MKRSTADRRARRCRPAAARRCRAGLAGILLAWAAAGCAAAVADDAAAWLVKINRAAAQVSFSGVFVHLDDGELHATRVIHRVTDGMLQARMMALNGERREVVRDADGIRCYLPESKLGVADSREALQGGFPRLESGDLARLGQRYKFTAAGVARIAGRMAQRIDIAPADQFRYGYHLWADTVTGLLLRSDLVSDSGEVLEKYQFVSIDFDRAISDSELQAESRAAPLQWYGRDAPVSPASSESADSVDSAAAAAPAQPLPWRFAQRPPGYELSRRIRRMSPLGGREIEHLIWSDGLSTLSIFIKPLGPGARVNWEGPMRMGAVQTYHRNLAGHRITVMGEVPARTVQAFAEGMEYGG
ncbi:MAG: MucB/RseB C-terminal domain-containing protein [Gammaproteobacteria bacterium]|nr:MucB/RseB C-terminal domain-containing protein [Gammaproteobacteria bacterium]